MECCSESVIESTGEFLAAASEIERVGIFRLRNRPSPLEEVDCFYIPYISHDVDCPVRDEICVDQELVGSRVIDAQISTFSDVFDGSAGESLQTADVTVIGRNDDGTAQGVED